MSTIKGTLGNDLINGTPEADVILALAGNDIVNGLFRDEAISGNQGYDIIDGGSGRDTIFGGKGNDTLRGGTDADNLYGDADDDILLGDSGSDIVAGGTGNDQLFGNLDNDILYGNRGNDLLNGNEGHDLLLGGKGNDLLFGEAGNDTLSGDRGFDILTGGTGRDVFIITPETGGATLANADIIVDFTMGADLIELRSGLRFEDLAISQVGSDTLIRLRRENGDRGDYLAVLQGVNANTITVANFSFVDSPDSTVSNGIQQESMNAVQLERTSSANESGVFISVDEGVLTINVGSLQPPTATEVRNNLFGTPIVTNPLAGIEPFINPEGTALIRDPATGELVPIATNQPGSIFSPDGFPTTPGITEITPVILPFGAVPPLFVDVGGLPRPVNELTIGGGSIPPFINPEGELVEAAPARVETF